MATIRVLVLDDDVVWQRILKTALQELPDPLRIDVAGTREEALTAIRDSTYDVIIADLALGGSGVAVQDDADRGVDLLLKIRESRLNHECAVIVVTGYPSTDRIVKILQSFPGSDFIEKGENEGSYSDERLHESFLRRVGDLRLRRAESRANSRYTLTLDLSDRGIVSTCIWCSSAPA